MHSANCYFLLVFGFLGKQYKIESKRRKNFGLTFSGREETLEGLGEDMTSHEEVTTQEARPPGLWAPRGTS